MWNMNPLAITRAVPLVNALIAETARLPLDVVAAALAMALGHVCRRAGVPVDHVVLVLESAFREEHRLAMKRAA
jgi:antitoxin component of RelBE/YafQ-DinJ toxin-antitoxin module